MDREKRNGSIPVFSYRWLSRGRLSFWVTIPFILLMVIPAFLLDIAATLYQQINFTAYEIPKVSRKKFIFFDRHSLKYLNFMEKFFCVYCGYFNGVMQYVSEIGARTEEFWCPIKHSKKVGVKHRRYDNYLEYGDGEGYHKKRRSIRLNMRSELENDEMTVGKNPPKNI